MFYVDLFCGFLHIETNEFRLFLVRKRSEEPSPHNTIIQRKVFFFIKNRKENRLAEIDLEFIECNGMVLPKRDVSLLESKFKDTTEDTFITNYPSYLG